METRTRVFVLTGPRGAGKSTLLGDLAARARAAGLSVAGLLTRRGDPGLVVTDLRTGASWPLAYRQQHSPQHGQQRGRQHGRHEGRHDSEECGRPGGQPRWRFLQEGLDAGSAALKASTPCNLLIVDEFGPLELRQGKGWLSALDVLAAGGYGLAVVTVRSGLTGRLREELEARHPGASAGLAAREVAPDDPPERRERLLQQLLEEALRCAPVRLDGHPAVQARRLGVRLGPVPVLHDVDLRVDEGERVLVTGASGSGKTTLLRCLTGIIPQAVPSERSGELRVCGQDPARLPLPVMAERVALAFQRPSAQLFHLHVLEEVAFGPLNAGLPPGEAYRRAREALEAVGLDAATCGHDPERRSVTSLSYGETQRLAIATALALNPRILILDEPMAHLDRASRERLVGTLLRLNREQGLTLVLAEHRAVALQGYPTRHLHIAGGEIVPAVPAGLAAQAAAAELADSVRLLCRPRAGGVVLRVEDLWLGQPQARGSAPLRRSFQPPAGRLSRPPSSPPSGRPLNPLLQEVNFELRAGEVVLVTGDNGAGKTTLALALARLLRPVQGRVELRVQPRMLFQDPLHQLFSDSVEEELHFGLRSGAGLLEELLDLADLRHLRQRAPGSLSLGEQRRAAIAALVAASDPDPGRTLLILDEPTAGQDDARLAGLLRLLAGLLDRYGCAAILITHDERILQHWPGRRLHLEDGRAWEMPPSSAASPAEGCATSPATSSAARVDTLAAIHPVRGA